MHDESSNSSSNGDEPASETTPLRGMPYPVPNLPTNMPPGNQATAMLNLLAQMTMLIQQKSSQNPVSSQNSQLHAHLQAQPAATTATEEVSALYIDVF